MDWYGKPSIELFQKFPLFSGLPREALAGLVARTKVLRLAPRQFLFHKGDPGDALYIVVQGEIQIGVITKDGRQVSFAQLRPGQIFGEIAVFDDGPRTADASAVSESVVLSLGRKDVLNYLDEYPSHAVRMIGTLCQRVRSADQLIEDLLFMSLPARVAKCLLALCDLQPNAALPVTVRISQQDLADQMSVSRESINRLLSKWEQADVVALSRGHITIKARHALETYSSE
ncbi:Crp/Fnr family transcriptional regulator [Magnetospirillum aberrantis]|uniref:Crp/Fnr family transcriptional regulator n=1 Tax=Magnetospirillum aberrantis SpK TaxID=908842 RepID=A0A7C9QS43_9PROT|nr:Crp/Fnr family transcriptional regulator [Magnetospirillum aberrantis]NFV79223.1 Crp/Fnr family transcriptional regulator [Magnetospirillum aberrantis SpK]